MYFTWIADYCSWDPYILLHRGIIQRKDEIRVENILLFSEYLFFDSYVKTICIVVSGFETITVGFVKL